MSECPKCEYLNEVGLRLQAELERVKGERDAAHLSFMSDTKENARLRELLREVIDALEDCSMDSHYYANHCDQHSKGRVEGFARLHKAQAALTRANRDLPQLDSKGEG